MRGTIELGDRYRQGATTVEFRTFSLVEVTFQNLAMTSKAIENRLASVPRYDSFEDREKGRWPTMRTEHAASGGTSRAR